MLGLSPGSSNVVLGNGDSINNSFIEQLYSKSLIDSRVFSLSLGDYNTNEKSVFTAGGYDVARFAKADETVTWNPVTDTTYWTLRMRKATIGDVLIVTSTKQAILDSGTSYLGLPTRDLKSMIDMLKTVHEFSCTFNELDGRYMCECPDKDQFYDKFPPLKITLSETNTYEIPNHAYTIRKGEICYINILPLGEQDFWILGDSFHRNYYTIYDLDNNQVGLVGKSTQEPF